MFLKRYLVLIVSIFCFISSPLLAQPEQITILHLNDTHSTLAPLGPRTEDLQGTIGGISRAATIIGMTRNSDSNVMLLHAGDSFIGDLFFNFSLGKAEFQLLNALDVDAMTVGNHDFDLTPAILLDALQGSFLPGEGFPLLSANSDVSAIPELDAYIFDYTIKQFGDQKIGIFGLTTPETNLLSQPAPVVISEDIFNIAGNTVSALYAQDCDAVILLSHLGVELDQMIAANVPGINIIVGGHDHNKYDTPLIVTNPLGQTTWIVQAKSNYQYIGKMKISVDNGDVQLLSYELIPLDANIPQEPNTQNAVDGLINEIETYAGVPFYTMQAGFAHETFTEEAVDLLSSGVHDTPAGNLVTDAFKWKTGTQIAIQAGGSTALPLNKGSFNLADLYRVNGYGFNTVDGLGFQLATFDIYGEALLMGLEFGLSQIEKNDEFFIQVSGLEYFYDGTKPAGSRLVGAKVNGTPIDPASIYSVTANELTISILNAISIPYSNLNILTGVTEFSALSEFVLSEGSYIYPKTLGRVINIGNHPNTGSLVTAGWLNSFAGSFINDPSAAGKLFVEMNVRKQERKNTLTGSVKIRFQQNNFYFRSDKLEWLLIDNSMATITGSGKINGEGNYSFIIYENKESGNKGDKKVRITIWNTEDESLVYDNFILQKMCGAIAFQAKDAQTNNNESEITLTPTEYSLEQNYPNPFNPSTTIKYSMPEAGLVKIIVYDILGNEVAQLINEYEEPGTYQVQFNASFLASGMYLYRIITEKFLETKKMILIK